MITHIHHDIEQLVRIDESGGRVYQTPTGEKYPSVTAVTGILNAASIQEWRNRVGEEAANRISKRASSRGTEIHRLCEEFLKNNDPTPGPFDLEVYKSMLPELRKIDNVRCLETPLFSHHLRVAGTVDAICDYDNDLSVIDFKTSSRAKKEEDIHHYFMQAAAYSFMFWERTGILAKKLTIIIGVDNESSCQVFQQPVVPWLKEFKNIREDFYKLYNK